MEFKEIKKREENRSEEVSGREKDKNTIIKQMENDNLQQQNTVNK